MVKGTLSSGTRGENGDDNWGILSEIRKAGSQVQFLPYVSKTAVHFWSPEEEIVRGRTLRTVASSDEE